MHSLVAPLMLVLAVARAPAQEGGAVFDEAWGLVREEFYDPHLRGVDWEAVRQELRPRAEAADSQAALSAVINDALSHLAASHTRHYHPGESAYYELLDVFHPEEGVAYVGVGIATLEIGGRTFIADIYDGGPAAGAGLRVGDEIVAVEGEVWRDAESFRGREATPTRLTIRRHDPDGEEHERTVTPARIRPHELFLASIHASARTISRAGRQVGYIRVRSYSSPEYHEAVMELATGVLAGADALILDIRGGWGGARASYMSLVNPVAPTLEWKGRADEEWTTFDDGWHKPLVLLIDGGSRSGKETLAYAYKKHGLATLVGERTAGAVLAGRPWTLGDGSVLYLAVGDVMVDGVRLEGVGVEPDIRVERELPYSAGQDPQLAAAVDAAARLAQVRATPRRP